MDISPPFTLAYILYVADNLLREILRSERRGAHKAGTHDKNSSILVALYPLLVVAISFLAFLENTPAMVMVVQWSGLVVMILGLVVHISAQRTLGKFYTGTLYVGVKQNLIKEGLYRHIRHPGYLGALLLAVGFGVASGNYYVLLAQVVTFIVVYQYRMKMEEKMLVHEFGSDYAEYAKDTKRLIPYVL